jgi:hypothetical protein
MKRILLLIHLASQATAQSLPDSVPVARPASEPTSAPTSEASTTQTTSTPMPIEAHPQPEKFLALGAGLSMGFVLKGLSTQIGVEARLKRFRLHAEYGISVSRAGGTFAIAQAGWRPFAYLRGSLFNPSLGLFAGLEPGGFTSFFGAYASNTIARSCRFAFTNELQLIPSPLPLFAVTGGVALMLGRDNCQEVK